MLMLVVFIEPGSGKIVSKQRGEYLLLLLLWPKATRVYPSEHRHYGIAGYSGLKNKSKKGQNPTKYSWPRTKR
jgi:hypothetical protein